VAVFGGSFNPPHVAHVLMAVYVLSACEVDEFLVVPTYIHPFAKPLAPYEDRWEMCRLAFGWLPGVRLSRLEQELGGPSHTLRTLRHLSKQHPEWRMRLVVGADVLVDAPRWVGFDEIRALAPPIVLGRVGYQGDRSTDPAVMPEVSSTQIREAIQEGRGEQVRNMVPHAVFEFAMQRRLYEAGA
jgi:nicotinate-nucleotide adenylyltransferase